MGPGGAGRARHRVLAQRAPAGRPGDRVAGPGGALHQPVRPTGPLHPQRGGRPHPPAAPELSRFGLRPGGYLLLVGRLVPEKAADLLVRAFRRLPTDLRLAIVGGSAFTDEYVARLREAAGDDPRIVFTDFVYGDVLAELYSHAAAFVQPSRLEGLPLTLLEAASYGLPVVASDIEPHLEVLTHDGPGQRLFRDGDGDDLLRALTTVTADVPAERAGAALLRDRVLAEYSWDAAARELEKLYFSLALRVPRRREPDDGSPTVDVTAHVPRSRRPLD